MPTGVADTVFALAIYLRNLVAIHLEFGILALLLGGLLAGFDLLAWWGLQAWAWHSSALFAYLKWLPSWLPTVWLLLPAVLLCSAVSAAAHWSLTWMVRATAGARRSVGAGVRSLAAVEWAVCAAWSSGRGRPPDLQWAMDWHQPFVADLAGQGAVGGMAVASARKSCDGHVQLVVEARSRLTQRLAGVSNAWPSWCWWG